jgi:hypothetical protein
MLQVPLTEVTAKFVVAPLTVGVTAPVPAPGPTEAGLSVQVTPVVYVPVTAQAAGAAVDPL